jgi:hypothetical protein
MDGTRVAVELPKKFLGVWPLFVVFFEKAENFSLYDKIKKVLPKN